MGCPRSGCGSLFASYSSLCVRITLHSDRKASNSCLIASKASDSLVLVPGCWLGTAPGVVRAGLGWRLRCYHRKTIRTGPVWLFWYHKLNWATWCTSPPAGDCRETIGADTYVVHAIGRHSSFTACHKQPGQQWTRATWWKVGRGSQKGSFTDAFPLYK